MQYFSRIVGLSRLSFNFLVLSFCRYLPWLGLKNWLYRRLLNVQIGRNVSVGLMAMFDIFFPQLISIGENSIIGYNATVLTHEFLVREYRKGRVEIGRGVVIGNSTVILPGVSIGDGAVVGACSLVNKDIPAGVLAAGVPARVIRVFKDEE